MPQPAADAPGPPTARGPLQAIRDVTAQVAAATPGNPVPPDLEAAFLRNRLLIARTHPTNDPRLKAQREAGVRTAIDPLRLAGPDQPVPGGVGYGCFFTDGFKVAFSEGAEIQWNVVCPDRPGGNVRSFLYLTATNRASLGVEALVAYEPDGTLRFLVFDWALPDTPGPTGNSARWRVSLSRADLEPYLSPHQIVTPQGPLPLQILPLLNSTVELSPGWWQNSVLLFDHSRNGWDQIYSHQYSAGLLDQQATWLGSWGPIVETFQPWFAGTAPMGALNVQLRAAAAGVWLAWERLAPDQSSLRDDNTGFSQILLDPNYDWLVVS
jgi:hypothetical protein